MLSLELSRRGTEKQSCASGFSGLVTSSTTADRVNASRLPLGLTKVLRCDNLSLPFRDESFDAVLSVAVVHHFATTERRVNALRELARVLRIGGRLIISVWAMEQRHRKFESQDVLVPWHRARRHPLPASSTSRHHHHHHHHYHHHHHHHHNSPDGGGGGCAAGAGGGCGSGGCSSGGCSSSGGGCGGLAPAAAASTPSIEQAPSIASSGAGAPAGAVATTTTSEDDNPPPQPHYHAYTQTSDSDSCRSTARRRGRSRHKGRSIDPARLSSSQSSSDLSSPNETCYSFVRRALQKLAGGKRSGSSQRPWFLETWTSSCAKDAVGADHTPDFLSTMANSGAAASGAAAAAAGGGAGARVGEEEEEEGCCCGVGAEPHIEGCSRHCYDSDEDIQDLPIELRRLEDENSAAPTNARRRQTFACDAPSSSSTTAAAVAAAAAAAVTAALGHKSKSLSDILSTGCAFGGVPGVSKDEISAQLPVRSRSSTSDLAPPNANVIVSNPQKTSSSTLLPPIMNPMPPVLPIQNVSIAPNPPPPPPLPLSLTVPMNKTSITAYTSDALGSNPSLISVVKEHVPPSLPPKNPITIPGAVKVGGSPSKPCLVKQKRSLCEDDGEVEMNVVVVVVEEGKNIYEEDEEEEEEDGEEGRRDMRDLVKALPEFKVRRDLQLAAQLGNRRSVFKQSSMNEELMMSTERQKEKERVRQNITKQASLNEDLIYSRRAGNSKLDSFFSGPRFQQLRNGLSRLAGSEAVKSKAAAGGASLKNGFVRMLQGWRGETPQESAGGRPPPQPPPPPPQPPPSSVANNNACSPLPATPPPPHTPTDKKHPSQDPDGAGKERRHSREEGSDSSKDSSLQSDTSVDSEDSFASVIFVPKPDGTNQGNAAGTSNNSPTQRSPLQKSPPQRSPLQKSPPQRSPLQKSPPQRSPIHKSPPQVMSPPQRSPPLKTPPPENGRPKANISPPLRVDVLAPVPSIRVKAEKPDVRPLEEEEEQAPESKDPALPPEREKRTSDVKHKETIRRIQELLRQRGVVVPGFGGSTTSKDGGRAFPLVRRASALPLLSGGRPLEPLARPLPRLLSLELFNPETDDLDSDSSGVSSPDSVGSVISVLNDEAPSLTDPLAPVEGAEASATIGPADMEAQTSDAQKDHSDSEDRLSSSGSSSREPKQQYYSAGAGRSPEKTSLPPAEVSLPASTADVSPATATTTSPAASSASSTTQAPQSILSTSEMASAAVSACAATAAERLFLEATATEVRVEVAGEPDFASADGGLLDATRPLPERPSPSSSLLEAAADVASSLEGAVDAVIQSSPRARRRTLVLPDNPMEVVDLWSPIKFSPPGACKEAAVIKPPETIEVTQPSEITTLPVETPSIVKVEKHEETTTSETNASTQAQDSWNEECRQHLTEFAEELSAGLLQEIERYSERCNREAHRIPKRESDDEPWSWRASRSESRLSSPSNVTSRAAWEKEATGGSPTALPHVSVPAPPPQPGLLGDRHQLTGRRPEAGSRLSLTTSLSRSRLIDEEDFPALGCGRLQQARARRTESYPRSLSESVHHHGARRFDPATEPYPRNLSERLGGSADPFLQRGNHRVGGLLHERNESHVVSSSSGSSGGSSRSLPARGGAFTPEEMPFPVTESVNAPIREGGGISEDSGVGADSSLGDGTNTASSESARSISNECIVKKCCPEGKCETKEEVPPEQTSKVVEDRVPGAGHGDAGEPGVVHGVEGRFGGLRPGSIEKGSSEESRESEVNASASSTEDEPTPASVRWWSGLSADASGSLLGMMQAGAGSRRGMVRQAATWGDEPHATLPSQVQAQNPQTQTPTRTAGGQGGAVPSQQVARDCPMTKTASLETSLSGSTSQESLRSDGGGAGGGGSITFHRYYHVFREGELDQLIERYVENLHIISSYYDHANWCVIAEKVQVWTI
ncbi:uncharacterized protein LOC124162967 [Ischnura elegans]|uniref:uncharacterized protein LOC124162967 n=1 Tax=Ischnura elegans TaxID=197161 RepID=UPI001ED8BB81|nr:uncharacterized protein LOC124162967 [Ischnura elegans]